MNSPTSSGEPVLHAMDYWQIIKNRIGIIVFIFVLVVLTSLIITSLMPKQYTSSSIVEVKQRNRLMTPVGSQYAESTGSQQMTSQFFGTEFEKIKSSNSLVRVVDRLGLTSKWNMERDAVVAVLKGIVNTQNIRNSDHIRIEVTYTDKEDARDIAEEVAKAYRDYRRELEQEYATKSLDKMSKAVEEQRDRVEELDREVTTIKRNKQIIGTGSDTIFSGSGLYRENNAASESMANTQKLEQEKVALQSQINNLMNYSDEQLIVYAASLDLPDNMIKSLQPQYLQAIRMYEASKSQGLGESHPSMKTQRSLIEQLKSQLNDGVNALRDTLKAKLVIAETSLAEALNLKDKKQEDALQREIDTTDYMSAKRKYEDERLLLNELEKKLTIESISAQMPAESIEIHEYPLVATQPSKPNVILNSVIGVIFGLIMGFGLAFFLEYIDTSVKSIEDVEKYLQVAVLGVIPRDVGLLHRQRGQTPDAEAYRILRTNLEFNRKNPQHNAITIVSGAAGEGKSTTLCNLAYVCAQGGYTTLMIDADLRRPKLHTFYDISNAFGLSNYLTTNIDVKDVILQTPIDNLFFMPSGIAPNDVAGILNSRRMSDLISNMKQKFDLVFIDSPPILGVSDASVLVNEVDLTMIVVQHRKLPRGMLQRIKQAIENVGGKIVGVVLNNVDIKSDSSYQYYTSYYTYYSAGDQAKSSELVNLRQNEATKNDNNNELY